MATNVRSQADQPRPIPIAPTKETWRSMTPDEHERFLVDVNDALSDPIRMMSEGRVHKKAKTRAIDYPGEESFSPERPLLKATGSHAAARSGCMPASGRARVVA